MRYSLRTLLLVTLALSIWLGWMANRAAKQRRAVELVKKLGGNVVYECGFIVGSDPLKLDPMNVPDEPPPENLLHGIFGHDWFHSVMDITLVGTEVSDEQLAKIVGGIPNVVNVFVVDGALTDAGLDPLASLERLEWVHFHQPTQLTAEGVDELRRLRPDMIVELRP